MADEIRKVLEAYAKIGAGISDFQNIRNPTYNKLAKKLKMRKKRIHEILCANQPQLQLEKYAYPTPIPIKCNRN